MSIKETAPKGCWELWELLLQHKSIHIGSIRTVEHISGRLATLCDLPTTKWKSSKHMLIHVRIAAKVHPSFVKPNSSTTLWIADRDSEHGLKKKPKILEEGPPVQPFFGDGFRRCFKNSSNSRRRTSSTDLLWIPDMISKIIQILEEGPPVQTF